MWICLNNAFLSIVRPSNLPTETRLLVRARFKGDIRSVFPGAQVTETPDRDYRFRALIDQDVVGAVIARTITEIDYTNFKDSCGKGWRHDTYLRVWTVMYQEQNRQTPRPPRVFRDNAGELNLNVGKRGRGRPRNPAGPNKAQQRKRADAVADTAYGTFPNFLTRGR